MEIAELTKRIVAKRAERGFTTDPIKLHVLLTEEVGEIAAELKRLWSKNYGGFQKEKLSEELADTCCILLALASEFDIDLGEAIEHKFFKADEAREWKSSVQSRRGAAGHDDIPEGVRAASRVILLGPGQTVLYLRARDPQSGSHFWVMPGGGLAPGESFEEAASRELEEEVGGRLSIGPYVWFRRHRYGWNGQFVDQYERFFVAHAASRAVEPKKQDDYVCNHRWWTLIELRTATEEFAPRNVAGLLTRIFAGDYPAEPIDCGV